MEEAKTLREADSAVAANGSPPARPQCVRQNSGFQWMSAVAAEQSRRLAKRGFKSTSRRNSAQGTGEGEGRLEGGHRPVDDTNDGSGHPLQPLQKKPSQSGFFDGHVYVSTPSWYTKQVKRSQLAPIAMVKVDDSSPGEPPFGCAKAPNPTGPGAKASTASPAGEAGVAGQGPTYVTISPYVYRHAPGAGTPLLMAAGAFLVGVAFLVWAGAHYLFTVWLNSSLDICSLAYSHVTHAAASIGVVAFFAALACCMAWRGRGGRVSTTALLVVACMSLVMACCAGVGFLSAAITCTRPTAATSYAT